MKKRYLPAIICLISPSLSFAFFCPTNFNQINYGNTTEEVIQACGKPDKQEDSTKQLDNMPQEWSYFLPQAATSNVLSPNGQTTLKTQITFDANGRVINISVNGIGVGASPLCGRLIQLGDTTETIKAACGDPSFVNKQTTPTDSSAPPSEIKITTFYYSTTTPPAKLVFENGTLKEAP